MTERNYIFILDIPNKSFIMEVVSKGNGRLQMIKRTFVRTRQLQPGMIIDQSIVDRTGRILIARNTELDDYLIESLLKLGVTSIYTREGEEDPEEDTPIAPQTLETIEKLKVPDRAKVTLNESVKKRVSEGIQYLYSNTTSNEFSDAAQNIAGDLMKSIMDNDAIAVDISTLKVSDEYTFKHSVDVATMAMIVAKKHGMSEHEVHEIGISGLLHDVGKSKIPNEILNKAGRLDENEFAFMKQHSLFGYQILKEKDTISQEIALGVLQHHEKISGLGYPIGLSGDKICPYARILSVVDVYDALVTERPYKKAFSQRDAIEIIMSMTTDLDISVIESFLNSIILYPVGCTVELSNGEKARVVENDPNYILRPKVVSLKTGKVYDLAKDIACANIIIF